MTEIAGDLGIHVDGPVIPGLPSELANLEVPCCMGAAVYGLDRCTCWEPIYDLEQQFPLHVNAVPGARDRCCGDCAYRNGSPERSGEDADWLLEIPSDPSKLFVCHAGIRRVTAWRHPLLPEPVPAGAGDYRPPIIDGRAYKADGTPADVCAGFLAHRAALRHHPALS